MARRLGGVFAFLTVLAVAGVVAAVVVVGPDRLGPDQLRKVPDRLREMAGMSTGWEPPRQVSPPPAQVAVQPVFDVTVTSSHGVNTLLFLLEVPDQAEAYQIDTDPNFYDRPWLDTNGAPTVQASVSTTDTGYQMVFARFRLANGSTTATQTLGTDVDPRPSALAEGGAVNPEWVRTASPRHLVIRVTEGRIIRGGYELYDLDNRPDGDKLGRLDGVTTVERDGGIYGFAVSNRRDVIRRPDRLDGAPINTETLTGPWRVSDGGGAIELTPVDVTTRPFGSGEGADGETVIPRSHDVVLELPAPLSDGETLTITPPPGAGLAGPVNFEMTSMETTSRAVHVNQGGFSPTDQPKTAVVSSWLDGIGDAETNALAGQSFSVVDAATGAAATTGTLEQGPWSGPARNELGRGDLTGSVALRADFSHLQTEGVYRVCVSGLGCSEPFPVTQRRWHDLTMLTSRAAYHQRSGIELGPPYTTVARPRPYHPDDGFTVLNNQFSLAEIDSGDHQSFERLASGALTTEVSEAWGGHFDAGDWDRRILHLWYARSAAFLLHEFPELAELDANIPESGDAIPDLLDEALWTVDFYRRLQSPDGAISGGVEAAEHPSWQSSSWLEDLEAYVYAPDHRSTYLYAAVAAEVSAVLRTYDQARADELLASALAAMDWAESHLPGDDVSVAADRNGAAAGLLFATGDQRWHDVFVESAGYIDNAGSSMSCQGHTQCDAAWLYLRSDPSVTDPERRDRYRAQFLASADAQLAAKAESPFGWMVDDPGVPLIWGQGAGGAPHATGLIKAHLLSGDPKYREAVVESVAFTLGANPLNQVFNTGIGQNPVRHPLIVDVNHGGLPVWPGTPMYGTHVLSEGDMWVDEWVLEPAGANPRPAELPYLHQWFDLGTVAFYNEFTVHQSHAEALLAFGYLAGTGSGS